MGKKDFSDRCCVFMVFLLLISVAATVPHLSDAAAIESPVERVASLARKAGESFGAGDFSQGLVLLEEAAKAVGKMDSGKDRAIAGYEIKDAVFNATEAGHLADASLRRRAILAAVQSLLPGGGVSPGATLAERVNDVSFLFREAGKFRDEGKVEAATDMLSPMLGIAKTLEIPQRPYGTYDLSEFFVWLLKESGYASISRLVKEMPPDDDKKMILEFLMHELPYKTGKAAQNELLWKSMKTGVLFDKPATLRYAAEAEGMIQTLAAELAADPAIKPNPAWEIELRKFIWRSYRAAGTPEEARQKLEAWIGAIRKSPNPVTRVRALKDASLSLRDEAKDLRLAASLLDEAEKEANLLNALYRAEEMEGIGRLKRGLKEESGKAEPKR